MADFEPLVFAYLAAWHEHDPARRREWIERCWSEGGVAIGPGTQVVGRDALDAEIARFHREMPGHRGVLTSGIDAHSRVLRFAVAVLDAEGNKSAEGIDIGEVGPDGLIAKIITFWGPLPAVPQGWPAHLVR